MENKNQTTETNQQAATETNQQTATETTSETVEKSEENDMIETKKIAMPTWAKISLRIIGGGMLVGAGAFIGVKLIAPKMQKDGDIVYLDTDTDNENEQEAVDF